MITQKHCWKCQKVQTGDVEWKFCPHCGASYDESHQEDDHNVEDNYVAGYHKWRNGNAGREIQKNV